MTTEFLRPSAKIYDFPVGGRRFLATAGDDRRTAVEPRTRAGSGDAIGEAWYHEAAIQEAKRTKER